MIGVISTAMVITSSDGPKGTSKIMYQLALLKAENQNLRAANETSSKHRRAKKTHLRHGGSLSQQEAEGLTG